MPQRYQKPVDPEFTIYGLMNARGLILGVGSMRDARHYAAVLASPPNNQSHTVVFRHGDGIWRESGGNPLVVTYKTSTEWARESTVCAVAAVADEAARRRDARAATPVC